MRVTATTAESGDKENVVLARTGEVRVVDPESGKQYISHHIPYGASLFVKDGATIKKGDKICQWDPFNAVIISEFAGIASFDGIEEGVTFRVERDDQTGHADKVIIESKNKRKIPIIKIVSPNGEELRSYNLPVGAYISIDDGAEVKSGQKIVKIPRRLGKIQDITGGLPRVTELFEARNPSNPAVVSEIDGVISFGKIKRGNREVIVTAKDEQKRKYLIGLSKHILIQEGDFVRAGTPLSDGATAPRDILNIRGPFAVQQYLVNGIQEVYRSQGITINNKHIEVIVRQMMLRVQIEDPGDTSFLEGEAVDKFEFLHTNDWIFDKDAVAATSSPLLQGITKSSLGTLSWISAASFQETTKVLSTAAIAAKVDGLQGLKENVIVGKKIPAGTGLRRFDNFFVTTQEAQMAYESRRTQLEEVDDLD
ncbi:UNVERIFIED_CONTAM: hypothetical protein GTU68_034442 [Idotea baltica]|nr:hypothetical protein [Idotea baltica]